MGLGEVESKSRGLRYDRGYRVAGRNPAGFGRVAADSKMKGRFHGGGSGTCVLRSVYRIGGVVRFCGGVGARYIVDLGICER